MTTTTRPNYDPAMLRRQAIKLAAHAAKRHHENEAKLHAAIRLAANQHGASLRELEEATGISKSTIANILKRDPLDRPFGGEIGKMTRPLK